MKRESKNFEGGETKRGKDRNLIREVEKIWEKERRERKREGVRRGRREGLCLGT